MAEGLSTRGAITTHTPGEAAEVWNATSGLVCARRCSHSVVVRTTDFIPSLEVVNVTNACVRVLIKGLGDDGGGDDDDVGINHFTALPELLVNFMPGNQGINRGCCWLQRNQPSPAR